MIQPDPSLSPSHSALKKFLKKLNVELTQPNQKIKMLNKTTCHWRTTFKTKPILSSLNK